jgi:murein DD-endopeptidase MepM/ murein hydrolase activator NlpD
MRTGERTGGTTLATALNGMRLLGAVLILVLAWGAASQPNALAASRSQHKKSSHKSAAGSHAKKSPVTKKTKKAKKPTKNARQLKRDLHTVRAKMHQKRVQIRETKKRERKITNEIETVETRLLKTEVSLDNSKKRLGTLAERQTWLEQRIRATEARLLGRRRMLASRVRQNYERGNSSYMQVLLKSRSLHDYMSRSYYVEKIVDNDVKLVEGIKADREQLAGDKKELDAQAAEQARVKRFLEEETAQYQADVSRKRELLQEVHAQRESLEEALDQMEESSHDIEAQIRAAQQTPRGRARMLHAWTGSFIRPANGRITSGFGNRFHPILRRSRMHTGVDIGAGYGSSIHAAAGGEVIFAGYRRGYGNCVIVDHGGGVSTLYGHCSSLGVSNGQTVRQGEAIARVGSTGMSTGPHLHFEVRHNGTPVNPL